MTALQETNYLKSLRFTPGTEPPPQQLIFRYALVFCEVVNHLKNKYGIQVYLTDLEEHSTGDLDGQSIWIEQRVDADIALYVLCHLFGHTVQWNIDGGSRAIGLDPNLNKTDEEIQQAHDYEQQAARLSLSMLHEMGIHELDQWVCDWFGADWEWLAHLYKTGESLPYRCTWRADREPFSPLPIPDFKIQSWEKRSAFF